jgi:hypothetical protein
MLKEKSFPYFVKNFQATGYISRLLSVFLLSCLSFYPRVCLSFFMSAHLFVCLASVFCQKLVRDRSHITSSVCIFYLCVCLYTFMSVHLFVCLASVFCQILGSDRGYIWRLFSVCLSTYKLLFPSFGWFCL